MTFLTKLRDELAELGDIAKADQITGCLDKGVSKRDASKLIDQAMANVKSVRQAQRDAERTTTQVTLADKEIGEGIYVIGPVDAPEMVKVQRSSQGNLYAKAYSVVEGRKGSFEYQPGLIKRVAAEGRKLTLDEAQQIGRLFGVCCDCGRLLTNPKSVARGIGPVCAGKY